MLIIDKFIKILKISINYYDIFLMRSSFTKSEKFFKGFLYLVTILFAIDFIQFADQL